MQLISRSSHASPHLPTHTRTHTQRPHHHQHQQPHPLTPLTMSLRLASSSASAAASTSAASASSSAIRQPPRRLLSASARLLQAPTPPPTLPRSQYLAKTPAPRTTLEAYRRYPNHPLNAFFQIKKTTLPNDDSAEGAAASASPGEEVSLPVSLVPEDIGKDSSRRSWMAPELRRKSSVELHQLWYVLLMEMNRMGTKWEEIRRNGVRDLALQNDTNVRTRMLKVSAPSSGRVHRGLELTV